MAVGFVTFSMQTTLLLAGRFPAPMADGEESRGLLTFPLAAGGETGRFPFDLADSGRFTFSVVAGGLAGRLALPTPALGKGSNLSVTLVERTEDESFDLSPLDVSG